MCVVASTRWHYSPATNPLPKPAPVTLTARLNVETQPSSRVQCAIGANTDPTPQRSQLAALCCPVCVEKRQSTQPPRCASVDCRSLLAAGKWLRESVDRKHHRWRIIHLCARFFPGAFSVHCAPPRCCPGSSGCAAMFAAPSPLVNDSAVPHRGREPIGD